MSMRNGGSWWLALALFSAGCGSSGGEAIPDGAVGQSNMVADPAPGQDDPGEYGCEGCPDTTTDVFQIEAGDVTSLPFSGTVLDADGNGEFYVRGPDGQALSGPIPTSADGLYSFTAPLFCGEQIVKCVWSNEAGRYALVTRVITTDCVDADIRITISWDELGRDWELHLIKPGGTINDDLTDCTWTSCIGGSPDWGVPGDPADNPKKDVDNTGTFGPENIFLAGPEAGTYTVMVEHWGGGEPSSGQAIFNVKGSVAVIPISGLVSHHVWTAGTIEWPSGVVRTTAETYDCSATWSGGCPDDLP